MSEITDKMDEAFESVIKKQRTATAEDKLARDAICTAVGSIETFDGVPEFMRGDSYYREFVKANEIFPMKHIALENGKLCILFTPNEFIGLNQPFRMTVAIRAKGDTLSMRNTPVQEALMQGLEEISKRNTGRLYRFDDYRHPYSVECWVKMANQIEVAKFCDNFREVFSHIVELDKRNENSKGAAV